MLRRKREAFYFSGSLIGFTTLVWYYWYYVTRFCKKPKLYVADGDLKERLEDCVPNLFSAYWPSPWLLNSHLMTVAGVIRRFGGDCYEREFLMLPDGGTVGLDWFVDSNEEDRWEANTPIVLVMHGLTGGSHEGYCRWMCYAAYKRKWKALVLNYRGCSGVPMTSPKGYNPVLTDDVFNVIRDLKKYIWSSVSPDDEYNFRRYPYAPLFAAAYSLGSLMLCKYLGESDQLGEGSLLQGAVMVYLMYSTSEQCDAYHRLKLYTTEHKESFEGMTSVDVEEVNRCRTIKDFEKATICQLYGFSSLDEYNRTGSSQFHIPHIKTKSLILVSEDDPFIGNLPKKECLENNNIALAVTSCGGHVAFLQGLWPFGRAWMEDTTIQFFTSCLF